MNRPLLVLTDIVRSFPSGDSELQVLKKVSLTIDAGEMVAIVGASGAGKSMLMHILGCLDRPTSGSYVVAGSDVGSLSSDELAQLRREHFGFIFQRYHLMKHLTALGNVEMPAIYAGSSREERAARARQLLARLGLGDRMGHRPHQLSGGQQQRVSIARALMNGGRVILADEPTGALDRRSGAEMISILHELNEHGHTVIIVTHDIHVAQHAKRIVEIADGEIVSDYINSSRAPRSHDVSDAEPIVTMLPVQGRMQSLRRWSCFVEAFQMALRSMMAHRLRTALTMLGIVIGITSIVSIAALGEGAKRTMLADIRAIAANTLDIYPGKDMGDDRADAVRTLTPADIAVLSAQPYVHSVTPNTMQQQRLRYRGIDVNANVNGVNESFFRVRNIRIAQGAAFNALDVRRREQVAVIDENTRAKLFGDHTDPIGKIILIGNLPCVVTAVTQEKRIMGVEDKHLKVWVPYTMAADRLFGKQYFSGIIVRLQDDQPPKAAEDGIVRLLTIHHGAKDFYVINSDSMFRMAEQTSQLLAMLLSLIAAISLVVGGIGVMNIMLVSVTERTQEIGIRMAVGARQSDVMQQFLTEAVVVCLASGAIGIALSYCTSFLFTQWEMIYSIGAILSAVISATLIGILFGYMPARNAARLNPIDALARE